MNYIDYTKVNNSSKDIIKSSLIKCFRDRVIHFCLFTLFFISAVSYW